MRVPSRRAALVYASGGLFAAAWWVFVDAVAWHRAHGMAPAVDAAWALPGLTCTLAGLMAAMTPMDALGTESWHAFSDRPARASVARCWLFGSFIVSFAGLAAAATLALGITAHSHATDAMTASSVDGLARHFTRDDDAAMTADNAAVLAAWRLADAPYDGWPGQAIVVQSAGILTATAMWVWARVHE